jgi:hypothetical protein
MFEWVQELGGPQFATALLWTLAALVVLVLLLVIVRLVRSLTFGTFVAGGRNRKTRLAVMDATAVDSHRRLVLIRRDDTEHLLLIGGPTDVVVERDIRLSQTRRPALTGHGGQDALPHPRPRLPEPAAPGPRQPEPVAARPTAAVPQPPRPAAPPPASPPSAAPAARRPSPPQAVRPPDRPQAPPPAPRPVAEVVLPPSPPYRQPPAVIPAPPPPAAPNGSGANAKSHSERPATRQSSLDETLLRELEVTFEPSAPRMPVKPPELTLDEEMTKLLGELSSHKRP